MEKLINEFKVIETEDGYRIEIKGDKEQFKKMFSRKGWKRWGRHRRRFGFGFPFGISPMMWAHAAGCCGPWDMEGDLSEEAEEEEASEG